MNFCSTYRYNELKESHIFACQKTIKRKPGLCFLYVKDNHLGNVFTTISDKKISVNPTSPTYVYCSPDAGQMSIDSLGGMKIQPRIQFGGVAFVFATDSGQTYNVKFYFRQGNTNTDSISGDQPVASIQNSTGAYNYINLPSTGSYVMNYPAVDTIAYFKPQYYLAGSTPNHYFYIDSLQITQAGSTADTVVAYISEIRSVALTASYGAPLNGFTWDEGSYEFSFNGKMKTDEVYGSSNFLDYGDRGRDTRLGNGWWGIDPLVKKYVGYSPYGFAANSPIRFKDGDGREIVDGNGNVAVKINPQGQPEFTQYATSDIKTVVQSMTKTDVGLQTVQNMVNACNHIEIEIDSKNEFYEDANGKITTTPSNKPLNGSTEVTKRNAIGELPDVKITLFAKQLEKKVNIKPGTSGSYDTFEEGKVFTTTLQFEDVLGATGTHEGVHATDPGSNRNFVPRGKPGTFEILPNKKQFKFYEQLPGPKRIEENQTKPPLKQ